MKKHFKNTSAVVLFLAFLFMIIFTIPAFAESGDITASGPTDGSGHYPFRVDSSATIRTGYNTTDTHTIGSYGLHIEGISEYDGNAFFDAGATVAGTATIGTLNMVGNIALGDGQTFTMGASSDAVLQWDGTNNRFLITLGAGSNVLRLETGSLNVGNGAPTISQASGESLYVEKTGEIAGILYPLGGIQSADGSNTFTIKDGSGHVAYTCSGGAKNFLITANTVAITGNGTVSGTLIVTGKITANGGIDAVGAVAVTGSITATGNGSTGGTFTSTGKITGNGGVDSVGDVVVTGSNLVSGNQTVGGTSSVTGTSTVTTMEINGQANVNGGGLILFDDSTPAVFGTDGDAEVLWNNTSGYLNFSPAQNYFTGATSAASVVSRGSGDFGGNITLENDETISNSTQDQFTFANGNGTVLTAGTNVVATGDIEAAGGYKMAFGFSQANVDASWTNSVINIQGETGNLLQEYTMPYAGSILAEAVAANVALTTGTITFEVTKNGTGTGLTVVMSDAGAYGYTTQAKDLDLFAAGDRIGMRLTSDAAVNPNTCDFQISVIVEM